MTLTSTEARQELLDALVAASNDLGRAVESLGAAYEQLDESTADQLEEQLFRPLQRALGRAKRAHSDFADHHGLAVAEYAEAPTGLPSTGVKGFVEDAVEAVSQADAELVALQESPMALEVGDIDLRAGVTDVRALIDHFTEHARDFVRTFGR